MTSPATTQFAAPAPDAASVRGRFLWYDLMTPDVDAATHFYPAVTGWTLTPWDMGGGNTYQMWTNAGAPIGGVMGMPAGDGAGDAAGGAPPHWLPYIGTPDVDATYHEALALGARSYVAPTDIPTVGRFAVLADPQGAAFAAFQPAAPAAPDAGMPPVGTFSWHELATSDRAAAWDFYARLFGWTETMTMDMGAEGPYQMFGQREMTYGGVFTPSRSGVPPHWMLYVRVADLERAIAAVRDAGGRVLNGPMEVPGGDHVAQCADPQGAMFALHASAHGAA